MADTVWLSSADETLKIGQSAKWSFMVPGSTIETTATELEANRLIAWTWSDGISVEIGLEAIEAYTAVTVVTRGFTGDDAEQVEAALNACEGFAIVLCDLKTLLESGSSAGLVASKAKLIARRAN